MRRLTFLGLCVALSLPLCSTAAAGIITSATAPPGYAVVVSGGVTSANDVGEAQTTESATERVTITATYGGLGGTNLDATHNIQFNVTSNLLFGGQREYRFIFNLTNQTNRVVDKLRFTLSTSATDLATALDFDAPAFTPSPTPSPFTASPTQLLFDTDVQPMTALPQEFRFSVDVPDQTTPPGSYTFTLGVQTVSAAAVPEPGSLILAGLAITGLGGAQIWNRRRTRRINPANGSI